MKKLFNPSSIQIGCALLRAENIDFIEIQKPSGLEEIPINYDFFDTNFTKIYFDPTKQLSIYNFQEKCDQATKQSSMLKSQ